MVVEEKESSSERRAEIPGYLLMDRTEAKGLRSLFDHNRHRNESFLSKFDYRLVLLMMTAVDSLNSWNMATFLTVQGFSAVIPLFIVTLLFATPFLFTELFVGGFAGTGLIWSIKNAVPLAGGIGIAMLIQAFFQLVEDIRNVGQLSLWTSTILAHLDDWYSCDNQWHNTQALELMIQQMTGSEKQVNLSCYSLEEFARCFKYINATSTACGNNRYTRLLDGAVHFHIYSFVFKRKEIVGKLDGYHILFVVFLLLLFTAIASLSFRLLATYGKYIIFGSFFLQSFITVCCAIYSRAKMSYGFNDISFLTAEFKEGLLSHHTWIRSAGLVFRTYGIAHGAMAAVARRSHQGKNESIFRECIMVVSITFLSQVLVGFFHILSAPGFSVMKDPYNNRATERQFFYTFPYLWGIYSNRVLHNNFISGGEALISVILILQIIKSLGKIIIYYDTVRVGIIEAIHWHGGWAQFRTWIPVCTSAAVFVVGSAQFVVPWGSYGDAWARSLVTSYLFQAFLAAALTVCVTWVYTLKRALEDVSLVQESKAVTKSWVYKVGVVYGKWLLPGILIVPAVTEEVLRRLDPWYLGLKTIGDEQAKIVETVATVAAFGLFSVAIIYAIVKICRQRRKGLPVRDLLRPTDRWGPCEIKFWVGEYVKLRFRYNMKMPVNTEEEIALIHKRNAFADRRISREIDTDLPELLKLMDEHHSHNKKLR